jgi:hypothetical protein
VLGSACSGSLAPIWIVIVYGGLQPAHQHQSRPFNIHNRRPSLNRCCPLIQTFTRIHIRRHSQHCTSPPHLAFLHPVSVRRKRACIHPLHKPAYSGDPVTFA